MYAVRIRDSLMIAHSLKDPFFGPAQNLHGATYTVDVEFMAGKLDRHNVVIDIGKAKKIAREALEPLSYRNLDEMDRFGGQLTTTEFLARHIHDRIREKVKTVFDGRLKVTLRESHDAWASYESDQ